MENYENEINNFMKLDGPVSRGPLARWQRKALEVSTSSVNGSLLNLSSGRQNMSSLGSSFSNAGGAGGSSSNSSKTPSKNTAGLTPSKTPKQSPGRNKGPTTTPGRNAKTPNGGDRFIPSRSASQFTIGQFMMAQQDNNKPENDDDEPQVPVSPSKLEYQRAMAENLNNGDLNDVRIMCYRGTAIPSAPEGYQNQQKVLYVNTKATPGSFKKTTRHIPQLPERILDAPEIFDDYYLNLIDWSSNNFLAVALGGHIYLWNASSGEINQLLQMDQPSDYVTSVCWMHDGNTLAVGSTTGEVQLWNASQMKKIRTMAGHSDRVGSLSWNSYILSSGARSGYIHHHDVRVAQHQIASIPGHSQEVCGLKWSPDGRYLASGGNDNLLNIWPVVPGNHHASPQPLYRLSQHQAAVKALGWCPWQPNILASGGGTSDRCIKLWNCNMGSMLSSTDTKSQVCSVVWSEEYKELVSAHGFANNQLILWKYPQMTKVAELMGHTARVLHLSLSPDGTTVVSAGADETLRLWRCFPADPNKKLKKDKIESTKTPNTMLKMHIR